MVRDRVIQRVVDQRRFARARYARHAHEESHRELERDALEVVTGGTRDGKAALRVDPPPLCRDRDLTVPGKVLPGERMWGTPDVLRGALRDDLSAVFARAGAHVDDVIGREDRVGVVLDNDHAVAQVAQMLECRQQAVVVALVQAD